MWLNSSDRMIASASYGMLPVVPYGHMVHEYYTKRVNALTERRREERAVIRNRGDAEALVRVVRSRIRRCFGTFPQRTPLEPIITGVIDCGDYRIEKVIFFSRPNFPVTANLYVPKQRQAGEKFPCVLGTCGHSQAGKAAVNYQAFCRGLARKGFVVLIYDPISQGERRQYVNERHPLVPKALCDEHNMLGKRMLLIGEWFGDWCAWDGIRALDYLLSRAEVDTKRVGVTGNSGGGTLAAYLNALDSRITMVAPSCFITTFARNISNELAQDAEQIPPGFLKAGLDMADYLIAQAPRPTLLLGQQNDYFDIRGLTGAFHEVRRIYALLGAEKNVQLFAGPASHGYFRSNREAMYGFFSTHAGLKTEEGEADDSINEERTLRCTRSGNILKSLPGSRAVFQETSDAVARICRPTLRAGKLRGAVRALLKLEKQVAPDFRRLRHIHKNKRDAALCISRFAIQSEPEAQAILYFLPAHAKEIRHTLGGTDSAVLYISHLSARADIDHGELDRYARTVDRFAVDVRGIGESMAITCHNEDFFSEYDADYLYASVASLLGEPYLGRKVLDVLQTISVLERHGYGRIHLVGRGLGAIVGAFSGLLAKSVEKVTLKNALFSYAELAVQPATKWPLSHFLPGVLQKFDLPDVYKALQEKGLVILDPWDEQMKPWSPREGRRCAARHGIKGIKFSKANAKIS